MRKHTPGPWIVNGCAIEAELEDGAQTVAHVYSGEDAPITGSEDANALLIASAPDMLEALRVAEMELRALESSDALFMARAAIAKAEGK